jgi:hypothetical protein
MSIVLSHFEFTEFLEVGYAGVMLLLTTGMSEGHPTVSSKLIALLAGANQ